MNITNKHEVRQLVIEALTELNYKNLVLNSPAAIELMMGTWAVESDGGRWLKQFGNGPARSAWMIEKPTFCDIIKRCNFIHEEVIGMTAKYSSTLSDSDFLLIETNHKLACQIARLKYFLCPEIIPETLEGQAQYWKTWYNTYKGAGTIDKYLSKYNAYVL